MLVITAQWYDRNQLQAEIERMEGELAIQPVKPPLGALKIQGGGSLVTKAGYPITEFGFRDGGWYILPEAPPREIIVERIVYRDRPVREVIETILIQEVIKEVKVYPPPLRNFESIPALREWLAKNMVVRWAAGGQNLDCEDYAADIQQKAYGDGYNIWQAPVTGGQIWGIRVTGVDDYHMGNMTLIGETFYYIETSPPNQGHITPLLNRD